MLISPRNECVTHLGNMGSNFGAAIFLSDFLLHVLGECGEQLTKFVAVLGVASYQHVKEFEVKLYRESCANDTRRHGGIIDARTDGNACKAPGSSIEEPDGLI